MIDFRSMIKSLQSKWVLRYLTFTENTLNSIFEYYVKPFGSELLLWSNFAINLLNTDMPKFYKDVITSWHSFIENSLPEDVLGSVHSQIIWNNQYVLIDKVSFYDREFHCVGLNAVKDLFDARGILRPFEFWVNAGVKHHKHFKWMSIVGAVPKTWKQRLNLENCVPFEDIEKLFNVKNINHKTIYDTLRRSKATFPTGRDWIKKHFKEEEIADIYTLSTRTKTNNKVKEMQDKILNKYLVTNTLLKKMKLKDTEMCTFCVDGREEMRHLFYECRFVSYFRVLFSNWWFLHTGIKIVFSYIDILFGYKITDPPILLHFCILTAKYLYISVKYS